MNKWIPYCLLILHLQCKSARQATVNDVKQTISLNNLETGTWKAIGPFGRPEPLVKSETYASGTGKFLCINIHPEHDGEILAGHASAGLFRSTDHGRTWTQKLSFPFATGISKIVRFRNDAKHLIAGTFVEDIYKQQYGYGLIESFDDGKTWQRNSLRFEPGDVLTPCMDIAVLDKKGKRLVAISQRHIYVSTDGAKTWTTSSEQAFEMRSIVVNPDNEQSVLICGKGVLYSRNGGMQWEDITGMISNYGNHKLQGEQNFSACFSVKHNNRFYMLAEDDHISVFRSSTDSLATGTLLSRMPKQHSIGKSVITAYKSKNGSEQLYVGTTTLLHSLDGGISFTRVGSLSGQYSINSLVFDKEVFYEATDAGINTSNDEGTSWTSITDASNLNAGMVYGFDRSHSDIMMCGSSGTGVSTFKNGVWYATSMQGNGGRVVCINDSTGFAVGCEKVNYMTTNAGRSFTYKHAGREVSSNNFSMHYHQRSHTFYLANTHLYKKKEGKYFEILSSKLEADQNISAFWVNPGHENEIMLCKEGPTGTGELKNRFFYTSDGGLNWLDRTYRLPALQQHGISCITKSPGNQVMIGLQSFDSTGKTMHKIYLSDRNGFEFTNVSKGLPNVPVNTVMYIKDRWICGNHAGVYIFREGKWEMLGSGLPPLIITEMRYNEQDNILIVSTFGRGLWAVKL